MFFPTLVKTSGSGSGTGNGGGGSGSDSGSGSTVIAFVSLFFSLLAFGVSLIMLHKLYSEKRDVTLWRSGVDRIFSSDIFDTSVRGDENPMLSIATFHDTREKRISEQQQQQHHHQHQPLSTAADVDTDVDLSLHPNDRGSPEYRRS